MLKNIGIRTKLIFGFAILSIVFISAIAYFAINFSSNVLAKRLLDNAKLDVDNNLYKLNLLFNIAQKDLLLMAEQQDVLELIRGKNDEDFFAKNKQRVELAFKNISEKRNYYSQISYIDENGKEIVRVDNINGQTIIIPDKLLANVSENRFFKDITDLQKGKMSAIYVNYSNAENKDFKNLSAIVYSIPVFDEYNNYWIISLSLKIEAVFDVLKSNTIVNETYLMDKDGYYIYHPNESKRLSGENNSSSRFNVKDDYAHFVDKILSGNEMVINNDTNIFAFAPVYLDPQDLENYLIYMVVVSKSIILGDVGSLNKNIWLFSVLIFILSTIFIILFSKLLTNSIKNLNKEVINFYKTKKFNIIPVKNKDEVSQLAESFNVMLEDLEDVHKNLEKKVQERTEDLTRMNNLLVGRELKMIELKRVIKKLLKDKKIKPEKIK